MFHARGPAAAKDRSPSDDLVRGTATELDAADLRPGLTVAAADGVIRSAMSSLFDTVPGTVSVRSLNLLDRLRLYD